MRIAVLGATGRTGRVVVAELLRRGHDVVALVRDPAKLGDVLSVRVVTGSSRDPAAASELLAGTDAVISALGPVDRDHTLHRDTATVLIAAMQRAGVDRFVGVSGAGIDVPGDRKSPSAHVISWLIQRMGGKVVQDKPAEYRAWAASDRTWTLVRPPRLKDGAGTGVVAHDAHRSARRTWIDRADLAAFLVDCVERDQYPRQAPLVAAAPRAPS